MLTRYKGHGPSIFSLYKRSHSSSILSKLGYLTNKSNQLKPLKESKPVDPNPNSNEDPIADVGIPATTIMSIPLVHYKHHQDIVMKDCPPISIPIKKELLFQKLELCSVLCDFTDPDVDQDAKKIKTNNLQEIDNLFSDDSIFQTLTNEMLDEIFKMININLFRGIPSTDPKYLIFDDEPPIVEINWPHLQFVYSILLKLQKNLPKDSHLNLDYLKKIYTLLEAPDINERSCVLDFMKKFIEVYPDKLDPIFHHFEAIVREYVDRIISPFPIIPILSLYLEVLKKPNHDKKLTTHFFNTAVIPLISSQHIVSFYSYLVEIFNIFIEEDISYIHVIIKRLVRVFPESCPSKQQLFIALINSTTGKLSPKAVEDFEKIGPIVFQLYANVANSSHAKIVQASLKIWSDVNIIPMIMDNTAVIFPIIFPSVHNVMKNHWNQQARNAALDAMTSMHDYDPFVFDTLSQSQQNGTLDSKSSQQIPKHRNWALIARVAARQDTSMNLARILADIQIKFTEVTPQPEQKKKGKRAQSKQSSGPKILSPQSSANFKIRP
ncbi:phosphoprotein phosphatase [Tritrichomonas foetus]|uniref:Phosphoprotein phosphatase n=1 Tax=Tritrichomonas foetus TaxID=1144522 RepID=A0A1J4JTB5_9EUKA|nr:phosphoprotein phosphatase [Tritrichomonas foetus]|eukprot:OHT02359.1 phosphoprotein phosphatase [Tritrichomonas foetus]